MVKSIFIVYLSALLLSCCTAQIMPMTEFDDPPLWAQKAIWYQIFVERFRNGDTGNDPNKTTMFGALIDDIPDSWSMTPWGHDWYQQEPWAKETGLDFYRTIQMRRYGGDLQGVIDKIPYLKKLGINAVYFNPLNDAPSLHKYDARHFHHIDVTFGKNRDADMAMIATEDKDISANWVWTSADKLFLTVIKEMHANGIKVILDFSWNHTGTQFWVFEDIVKNGELSRYKNWYEIKSFTDSTSGDPKLDYEGWFGISSLPELKKIKHTPKVFGHGYEGNMTEEAKRHIFEVCKRWMDPSGNGDVSEGIDGMRLDVAEHVPMGFWRDLRRHVRSINPDFYLVGENWWESWPDKLMDPSPWVGDDVFDAVMHYHWFKPARQYFNQGQDKITLEELISTYKSTYQAYRPSTANAMMNLASSHDSERALSSFFNDNKYKHHGKPSENPGYRTSRPDSLARNKFFALLIHQFTFVGSPHIWNGDEMGMWGADDPDNRKPMIWPDINFSAEHPLYHGNVDRPIFDKEIFNFYASLCQLRLGHEALQLGSINYDETAIFKNIFSYTREVDNEKIKVILNVDNLTKIIPNFEFSEVDILFKHKTSIENGELTLLPYSGLVIKVD